MRKLISAFIISLFISVNCFGATVTRYVNTASSGGDGTTNAESGATAAYASLYAFEDAEDGVSHSGNDVIVYCTTGSGSTADTAGVTFDNGWDADSITITGEDDFPSDGQYSTSHYRLEVTGERGITNDTNNSFTIEYLQIYSKTDSTDSCHAYYCGRDWADDIIQNCIIKQENTGSHTNGIYRVSRGTFSCINNLIIGNGSGLAGISLSDSGVTNLIANNTIYGTPKGIYGRWSATTILAKNNVVANCTTNYDLADSATFDTDSTNNAGDDETTPEYNTYYDNIVVADNFTDASNGDFSVKDTDADIYDAGTDLSGTFTDDITGYTRVQWDIGAFEYQSASPSTFIPIIITTME